MGKFSTLNALESIYDRYIELKISCISPLDGEDVYNDYVREINDVGHRLIRVFERAEKFYPDSELVRKLTYENIEESVYIGVCPFAESWE